MNHTKRISLLVLFFAAILLTAGLKPVWAVTEGCTPGYWKNHLDMWPAPFRWDMTLGEAFDPANEWDDPLHPGRWVYWESFKGYTLLDALNFQGGPGAEGGIRILMRHAVAALLNSRHTGISRFVPDWVMINAVQKYVCRDEPYRPYLIQAAGIFADWNEMGCPLSNGKPVKKKK